MKNKYQIEVSESDQNALDIALNWLKVKAVITHRVDATGSFSDYEIDLSKYELLYLRLTCKWDRMIKVQDDRMMFCDE